jgi:SAM-dependent methyltransferase
VSPGGADEADPLSMLTAYQHSAIIATAVETGVADAIASGPRQAGDVAAELDTHAGATTSLLGGLAALGLAEKGDQGFSLSQAGAELAADAPGSIAEIARKEWFFYRAWAGLPHSIEDGSAQIGPWRERLRDDPAQSLAFLRALDDLAARFGAGLPELAGLEHGGELLDVGGGAGSHSAYLVRAVTGLTATVLDLPQAEQVLRERHPELGFVAGDLERPRFGRPEEDAWDYVLLANILHDHPPARCRELVAEAARLLAPGGILLIYEWVLGADGISPPAVALFSLMMLVENQGGGTWTEAEIAAWIEAAGLAPEPVRRDPGPISVLRARKPGAR